MRTVKLLSGKLLSGGLFSAAAGLLAGLCGAPETIAGTLADTQRTRPVCATGISGWGSSTVEFIGADLERIAAGLGTKYYNGGDAGVWSDVTLAQQGAEPALLTFAAGRVAAGPAPVAVSVANVRPMKSIHPFSGTLAGTRVQGTLAPANGGWSFSRSDSGAATAVPAGVAFLPDAGLANRDTIQILNIGKNDILFGASSAGSLDALLARISVAGQWNGSNGRRVLILGHFVPTGTLAQSPVRARILTVNTALQSRYPDRYIDLSAYLTGPQIWADSGLTPTPDDLAQQALGNKPPSLSRDSLHLNAAGNAAVARHLIAPRLATLCAGTVTTAVTTATRR